MDGGNGGWMESGRNGNGRNGNGMDLKEWNGWKTGMEGM